MYLLRSDRIRVKVFLRDDIFSQITHSGFTALSHVTARSADSLVWSEDQILNLIVNRLAVSSELKGLLSIDSRYAQTSKEYQSEIFYRVFPKSIHRQPNQSNTLAWIYNHVADGRRVVTPRDVIDLLTRAKQNQQDQFNNDRSGTTDYLIGSQSVQYGLKELSKKKRDMYLYAEFPQFKNDIDKFVGGKAEYSEIALQQLLGDSHSSSIENLVSIGLLAVSKKRLSKT